MALPGAIASKTGKLSPVLAGLSVSTTLSLSGTDDRQFAANRQPLINATFTTFG